MHQVRDPVRDVGINDLLKVDKLLQEADDWLNEQLRRAERAYADLLEKEKDQAEAEKSRESLKALAQESHKNKVNEILQLRLQAQAILNIADPAIRQSTLEHLRFFSK